MKVRDFRTDVLLLLVGTNPLPNAVAAHLISKPEGRIVLLETAETKHTSQRLIRWIENRVPNRTIITRRIDHVDPSEIYGAIKREIGALNGRTIGLNYTGGSKSMSVHAVRALETNLPEHLDPVVSYLDASTLSMLIESLDSAAPIAARVGARTRVEISIGELVGLHDWVCAFSRDRPLLPLTSEHLLRLAIDDVEALNGWRRWTKQNERPWETEKARLGAAGRHLGPVIATLADEIGVTVVELESWTMERIAGRLGLGGAFPVGDAVRWFRGSWLESAVFQKLQSVSQRVGITDVAWNVLLHAHKHGGHPRTEIDCMAMAGYQTFGISCTTDPNWQGQKAKALEIRERMRQLGGAEARSALVCPTATAAALASQIRAVIPGGSQFVVFGQDHLEQLDDHLANWILTESKQTV